MLDRREWMKRAGMAGLTSHKALALDMVTLPFDNGERPLVRYPQKRPMIGLTSTSTRSPSSTACSTASG